VDFGTLVSRSLSAYSGQFVVRLRLRAPAHRVAETMPPWLGVLDPVDDASCILSIGLDDLDLLPSYAGDLRVDFDLVDPPEAAPHLRGLARRLLEATGEEVGERGLATA
jgi:hypothetical protein